MLTDDVDEWFGAYLDAINSCLRGGPVDAMLRFSTVPLILTEGDEVLVLGSERKVRAHLRADMTRLREQGYVDQGDMRIAVEPLNPVTVLVYATISRERDDGSSVDEFSASYLVVGGPGERRIQARLVRSPARP